MIIRKNIVFLIFIITVTFEIAGVQSAAEQDNESNRENAGTSASTTESQSQSNQDATSPDHKRQEIDSSDTGNETGAENSEKSTTNDPESEAKPVAKLEFPEVILDYFTNPHLRDDELLGRPNSYYESNNEFKKLIFDFEKNLPFVVQREKFKIKKRATRIQDVMNLITDTIYFQASSLLLEDLEMEDIKDPKNTNRLNVFLREKDISEDEFNRHNYYYFSFSTGKYKQRFIATCPNKKEITVEFPSEPVLIEEFEKVYEIVETSLDVDEEAEFSSDEDEDTKSLGASPKNSLSTRNTSFSSSPGRSESSETPATFQIQTEISALPSSPNPNSTVVTDQINRSPTGSKSSPSETVNKTTSHMLNFKTPLRFLRNLISHSGNEQPSASAIKTPEKPKTITVKNTFKGKVLKKRGKTIQENEYNAFNHPCTTELKPTYVKLNEALHSDKYFVGYLVDFGARISPLVAHLLTVGKTKLWFHIGHLLMDTETKDTYSMFNFAPFYETVSQMYNIPIYTDYTAEENVIGNLEYYTKMYSKENQKEVFECFENYEKYYNPDESLILVQQELMDQKSVPVMSQKRAALDYMNIAPMYKIIKDTTWNRVENVVLKVPFVTNASTVMFITGTYGSLKIDGSTEGVYLDKDGKFNEKKRIKVPYAFYKIMHIEYAAPRLTDTISDNLKFFLNIVIVTHNDPFETDPQKICDTPVDCASIGWAKVEQKDPRFGFTYCCEWTRKFSEDMRIISMYESLQPHRMQVLDLRTLWFIEHDQASNPLQPKERVIIKELEDSIKVYKDSILKS